MKFGKASLVIFGIILAIYLMSVVGFKFSLATEGERFELRDSTESYLGFALDTNDHFMAAGNCDGCHGYDETGHASVDEEGNDISPVTTWRATMMANSARDPFFRAKVSHESAVNPQHQSALEDKCTSCHAPLGRFSNHFYGYGPYGLSDLESDPMGQDGVSCMACHKQTDEQLGVNHSGDLHYASEMVEYGPFEKPLQGPMQGFVGVSPEYSAHVTKAGFCAGCHTLLTNSTDLQGNFTGTTFVEQATYHEWLNSNYNQESGGITCQGCHVPRVEEDVVIASYYQVLQGRSPYGKHELVGGNTFMLKIMKTYREQLDIRANEIHFDSTIARTYRNLQEKSVISQLSFDGVGDDTAYFSLHLENITGHKFPSGYPSRRAYVEFIVTNNHNDTVFSSGVLNSNHGLDAENSSFEPHYDAITNPNQVQIYEMVMGDIDGNVTTILEQAYEHLKDNRLVPRGFSTLHSTYDTTAIVGNASVDNDFNFDGFEGSGSDIVHFHVPLNGTSDTLRATSRLYYQSVPKKWVQQMFSVSTAQIDTFETMFNNADHTPVLVASNVVENLVIPNGITEMQNWQHIQLYPNPSNGIVWIQGLGVNRVATDVFNVEGKLLRTGVYNPNVGISLPEKAGVYILRIRSGLIQKCIRIVRT